MSGAWCVVRGEEHQFAAAFQSAGSTAPGEVHQQLAERRKRLGITSR